MQPRLTERRKQLGVGLAAIIYVFGSATTFSTMGLVLFAMLRDLHWSETVAGGAFTTLILVCSVAHLLPVPMIAKIGARWTIVSGGVILAIAFMVAYATRDAITFYIAAGILGVGFSLVANAPGVYLITGWFGQKAPRMIGIYLMVGTLGNAVGPPVAQALISSAGGWRLYWLVMTGVVLVLSALCAIVIQEPRDAPKPAEASEAFTAGDWRYRDMLRTPQFIIIAVAMTAIQICMITISSVTPSHMARLGWPVGFAAGLLGMQGFVGTLATGVSGRLSERIDPKALLVCGLLSEALGVSALAFAGGRALAYAFVLFFGIGWSLSCLAVTVLLVRNFGQKAGVAALATLYMLAGASAIGPIVAGMVADATGSFAPALGGLAAVLLPIALAVVLMPPPGRRVAPAALDPQPAA
jgi:cyanate permease